jgi:ABC-type Mn2+/Zn2+ transport system ATPase subunit
VNTLIEHGGTTNTSTDDPILVASCVRLGYGDRAVLDRVSFSVRPGEFWFVIGPNGHGKTTLLRAMLGRVRPHAGAIHFHGDFARPDRMGFVPQHCDLNPTLPTTLREFVLLGLVGIPCGKAERRDRFAWALDQVGLRGLESSNYWSLSGGQRQRALVARALVRRPRLLVADEPTSGLDLSVESALYESLAELNRTDRLTVVLVTHDLAVAARYGTHVALVHDGHVDAGRTNEILQPGNLERAYRVPIEVCPTASGAINVRLGLLGPSAATTESFPAPRDNVS